MLLRASVLALATISTLATTALVSTPASAGFSLGRGIHASDDWESHIRSHGFSFGGIHGGASHEFQCCRKHPT
jgi:hypothetical protein